MDHHRIPARPKSMVFGYLDARISPVLAVGSGETVELESVPAGRKNRLPADGGGIPPLYGDALAAHPGGSGSHFITGPVPVFNEGALFMAGDGHGVQGDGEVCVTALETGLTGTFRLTLRISSPSAWTRIWTTPPDRRWRK